MNFTSITVTLFLIMDPMGNIPSFLKMVEGIPVSKQRLIIFREMGIALAVMLLFYLLGETIFSFLNLSEVAVTLSSGAVLFLFALRILYPSDTNIRANLPTYEPFIVPLAIPLIAGPSLLATIMLFSHIEKNLYVMPSSILLAWAMACGILLFSSQIKRVLKTNGLLACEKLVAMILLILSIQRFMDGISLFLKTHAAS